jgi:hypothetical protein
MEPTSFFRSLRLGCPGASEGKRDARFHGIGCGNCAFALVWAKRYQGITLLPVSLKSTSI